MNTGDVGPTDSLELYVTDVTLSIEQLPDAAALNSFACATTASSASCPGSSASSLTTASTYSG